MDDDNPTIREDIGYRGPVDRGYRMQRIRTTETKRIRYMQGIDKGIERDLEAGAADALINSGMAIEVGTREPGEEG